MTTKMLVFALMAVVSVTAEPPSARQYIPPDRSGHHSSGRYGAPFAGATRFGAPLRQYGAPSFNSNRLGALSNQYGAPSFNVNRFGAPSSQYGSPSLNLNHFGAPSNQYATPFVSNQFGAPASQYGAPLGSYGFNGQDPLAEPANYEFSYKVEDYASGNDFGHQESRQGQDARGSYHVLLPDGRTQIVDYVANEAGYTPTIRYEGGHGGYASTGVKNAVAGPY